MDAVVYALLKKQLATKASLVDGKVPADELPSYIATKDYVDNKPNLIKITWSELKALRDSGQLIPGRFYRITDYICTTTQANTQSAGHVFDIIVRADSENKLNEEASAIQHEGDDYFTGCNLQVWKLWYCLDNDSDKFLWADSTNGKGVIYRMIDEFGNDCPYDFKNMQFKRCKITECQKSPSLAGRYLGIGDVPNDFQCYTVDAADFIWCYTFTWINENNVIEDCSVIWQTLHNAGGLETGVLGNKIERCQVDWAVFPEESTGNFAIALNNIIIQATYEYKNGNFYGICCNVFSNDCSNNTFGNECSDNAFGSKCCFNTAGNGCSSNVFSYFVMANTFGDGFSENKIGNNIAFIAFGNECYWNTLGDMCDENTFGNGCVRNVFGSMCYSNTFGDNCCYNSFSNECYNNALGEGCSSNTFGESCHDITFSDNCIYNTFGTKCERNTFGGSCSSNTFGKGCFVNTFGNQCNTNTFGDLCINNTFGNDLEANVFGDSFSNNAFGDHCSNNVFGKECQDNVFGNYCKKNIFGNGCRYIIFGTRSDSTNTPADYYENNTVDNYCGFLCLKNTSGEGQVRNIHVHSGVIGDSSAYKIIAVGLSLMISATDVYPTGSTEMFI